MSDIKKVAAVVLWERLPAAIYYPVPKLIAAGSRSHQQINTSIKLIPEFRQLKFRY